MTFVVTENCVSRAGGDGKAPFVKQRRSHERRAEQAFYAFEERAAGPLPQGFFRK